MHSKLIRLQTALLTLALLFTVLIPVSAYAEGETAAAQATADGSTTISDPNTLNAWERTQAYNNATTGRIWADKTVEKDKIDLPSQDSIAVPKDDKDADFLVALSALSSYASTTTTNTQALDIVMVLDASDSMDKVMGKGDNTKRMDALKNAVNAFIDSAAAQNAKITDKEKEIQLSIVKFAKWYTDKVGNDTLAGINYSQIVKDLTVCDATNAPDLKKEVNKIKPGGATRADYGLQHAQTVLNNARPNAKKVVIFFTDGSPNKLNGFDNDVASDAIKAAKDLKDAGAVVYTVGIFKDADPKADVSKTSNENKFMQAVSSNYPSATYARPKGTLKWKWDFGDRPNKADYYMAASSADGLKNVFENIFTSVSTTPAGPTQVTDKPQEEGYVTFDDPLGDYMEVKDFEAVAFAKQVFRDKTVNKTPTVDTYTFTGHSGTVSDAYPNAADLKDIIITVTHGNGSDGDHVRVQIPASMLPLRYYKATSTDGTPKLVVNDAQPISVIYSVGLNKDARKQIASGSITDATLAAYVAQNAKDGKIDFYSNKFDSSKTTTAADGTKRTIGLTTATFTPATSNSFYYHTEDTLLYTSKSGDTPATVVEPRQTYYYKLNYLQLDPGDRTQTVSKTDYVPVSIATQNEIKECIKTEDGKCYIKKGIKKGSLPSAIDNQLGDKKEADGITSGNRTGTADRRIDFQWNLVTDEGVLYLGNNGKLTMNATGSLKVTKMVTADAGLTPNRNTDFTMQFTLTGDGLGAGATYNYTVTNAECTKVSDDTIQSNGTFKLKDGETAEIVGLPAGSTYTITEPSNSLPAGYTPRYTNNTGEVKAGTAQEVTVTNTYNPAPIIVSPDDANYPFKGVKILTGRDWKDGDKFGFKLEAVDGAPLRDDVTDTYIQTDVGYTVGLTGDGAQVPFDFGSITFTKPGTYEYKITENIPTEGKIPGVSYDNSSYSVTVTITDNGSGQLEMTDHTITKNGGTEKAETATFVNTYHADDVTVTLNATKKLNVVVGNRTLNKDDFSFNLSENGKVIKTATNEADGKVTFTLNFTSAVGQKTYVISEVNNHLGGIGYDTREYEVTFTVRDNGEGKLVASPPRLYAERQTRR